MRQDRIAGVASAPNQATARRKRASVNHRRLSPKLQQFGTRRQEKNRYLEPRAPPPLLLCERPEVAREIKRYRHPQLEQIYPSRSTRQGGTNGTEHLLAASLLRLIVIVIQVIAITARHAQYTIHSIQ